MTMTTRNKGWLLVHPALLAALGFSALLMLSACQKPPEAPPPAPAPAAAPKKLQNTELPAVPPPDALAAVNEKSFDPKLMRDPFKPFIRLGPVVKKTSPGAIVVPKTPLQKFAIEELKFVGILWSEKAAPQALVEDPTGKGYTVKVGTYVGNRGAKIVKIQKNDVVVEEIVVDVLGEENTKLTTIQLHKPENEVNP